ncbi:MAG: CsgG/HfaB family protein, partial [bacterium]
MNRTYRFLILGLVLSCLGNALASDSSAATVAIVDFAIPPESSNTWGWARGGIADLLQIELDHRGLVTLDRSFIQAVLSERRMTVGGLTSSDCRSIATLLGAKYLVTGKVIPLEGGKCRIEASAFSVETIETVGTGSGEGVLPKDLTALLQQVADSLIVGILKGQAPRSNRPRGFVPGAEALIAYYRGLTALANDRPEAATAWFINAAGLDSKFLAPQVWEIRAYRAMGMEDHARIREDAVSASLNKQGAKRSGGVELTGKARKTVAVLAPLLVGDEANSSAGESQGLMVALKQAVVSSKEAILFDSENITLAVAEHDRQLNPLFSRPDALRYGRWLTVDALLLCRVESVSAERRELKLSLQDPLAAAVIAEQSELVGAKEVTARVGTLFGRLVEDWETSPGPRTERNLPLTKQAIPLPGRPATWQDVSNNVASRVANGDGGAGKKVVVFLAPDVGGGERRYVSLLDAARVRLAVPIRRTLVSDGRLNVLELCDSTTNRLAGSSRFQEEKGYFAIPDQNTSFNYWRQRGRGLNGVDAWLKCLLQIGSDKAVELELTFLVPGTFTGIVSRSDKATIDSADRKLEVLTRRLIDDWIQGRKGHRDDSEVVDSSGLLEGADMEGLPVSSHPLALALRRVRAAPKDSEAHRALADAYSSIGRPAQYAL